MTKINGLTMVITMFLGGITTGATIIALALLFCSLLKI